MATSSETKRGPLGSREGNAAASGVRLSSPQWCALYRTKTENGRYWPNDKARVSLIALRRRGLVEFRLGYGWFVTPAGVKVLGEEDDDA